MNESTMVCIASWPTVEATVPMLPVPESEPTAAPPVNRVKRKYRRKATAAPVPESVPDTSTVATPEEVAAVREAVTTPPVVDAPAPANAETAAPPSASVHHFLLPRNLACLADLCHKEGVRYAMDGVQLTRTADGYTVNATDGRLCGMVKGTDPHSPADYPALSALTSSPNGGTTGIIHAVDWRNAFKMPAKRTGKPILETVPVVLGNKVATFATTDLERVTVSTPALLEGRFPPVVEVLPAGKPIASICIDPYLMIRLLKAASAFTDDETRAVRLDLYGSDKPLVIKPRVKNGQEFTGVMMPLS